MSEDAMDAQKKKFREHLAEQRWDDHRFYHHSLVNQSLHMLSACTFVVAYALAFHDIALASLLGWLVAMTSRQCGHFFFEPKGYDAENGVTHEYKEEVKVGYNLARKWVFMGLWAASPLLLVLSPSLFGLVEPHHNVADFARHVGHLWLGLGVAGLLFRVGQLAHQQDMMTGIVWATKIVTDPFNDIKLYHRAPLRLLKGERIAHAG
ncbi:hypothetical protein [Sphingomonas jatrophae]|uniref:DUF962 domain-containing protein n=1 Tax=Sphingomonas jatrophae TaxID=1166337 RepID=A0A1I6JE98_9SPHN|nr:hypothetical protein [Sphingomonas jatrophae]SFR77353.1 hypothetical protein SAMN05192580_0173 [Sphingomonas jatrophae]